MNKLPAIARPTVRLLLLIGLAAASMACFGGLRGNATGQGQPAPQLWAGISADSPVIVLGSHQSIQLSFALINDSDSTVNPGIDRSKLVINGQEWPDSALMFGNGPRDSRFEALPAGDYLLIGAKIPDLFADPGTYLVSWRGAGYESASITVRVLPQQLVLPTTGPKYRMQRSARSEIVPSSLDAVARAR